MDLINVLLINCDNSHIQNNKLFLPEFNSKIINKYHIIRIMKTQIISELPYLRNQQLKMQAQKGKPYMIQLYDATNNQLGKYKFVISASKVSELKDKIHEKLVAKKQLQAVDKIVIKDYDDFQLGSDDQVNDVVADNKVKVYLQANKNVNNEQKKEVVPDKNQQPQSPIQPQIQSQSSIVSQQASTQSIPANLAAVDTQIIDIKNCVFPSLPEDYPKNKILTIFCPQIRKSSFNIQAEDVAFLTFYQFSQTIIKKFNLDSSLKALPFTQEGQPLLFNLDLIHKKMPKLDFSRHYYIIFSATKTLCDIVPAEPTNQVLDNQIQLKVVISKEETLLIKISLANSLSVLKYKIFKEIAIHPCNQIIKFANNALTNEAETLTTYNLKAESIVQLHFKTISNLVPASYTDKFYYKDVQLIHPQSVVAQRALKTNLLALGAHLNSQDQNKVLGFLRYYTSNQTLVCAFRVMFYGGFLSQVHRIALQEGIYTTLWHYLSACAPPPKTQVQQVFGHIRDLFGYIIQSIQNSKVSSDQVQKKQSTILIQNSCTLTTKPIKNPSLIKLDDKTTVVVDRNQMLEQIDKGYSFPLLKKPLKTELFDNYSLLQNFDIFKFNQTDIGVSTSVVLWLGSNQKTVDFTLSVVGQVQKYQPKIVTKYTTLKIHEPLQVKNKSEHYLMLLNKQKQLRVFIGRNKDINRPHIIFDVITGKQESVSLDLMTAAGKTQNLQEAIDLKDLKPVITREPKQAIVVLFDISGSMGGQFFAEKDLKRIGACKLFFEALAYRTIAYSFQHVVSLVFFDYSIDVQCDFTESIYDFNRLIAGANPRGSTKLYDSIINAVDQLLTFKKRYPECILRILAMTDGQDTASQNTIFDAAKAVVQNDIIMDSFAVGASCEGLKSITLSTGGKCYLTRNVQESLKLFQQETVLSVRARKVQPLVLGKSDKQINDALQKARFKPFDLGNDVHQFKMPQVKGSGLSSTDMAKKFNSQQGQKKLSGNASLKRIAKQIQNYSDNPHPFVAIYPCQNINLWKILLLGPKQTPYQNGLFLLYASFPGDYPFRAPEIRFITPIYHCNMNQQGRICHSVFDRNYSPALTFRHIIDCVYGLILTPEPDDPLDNVVATFFLSQYPTYVKNAKQATQKNASKTPDELVEEIFGKIADDIEKQKRVVQLEKWIQTAKSFN